MSDVPGAKERMRDAMRARLRGVDDAAAREAGIALRDHVLAALPAAGRVGLFASRRDEIPTRPLFDALRDRRREVLLPRVAGDHLIFSRIDDWAELVTGAYGLAEPPDGSEAVPLAREDWLLVPGVAFDRRGARLGRGQGFYDRALAAEGRPATCIGAAFAFQVVESVPTDSRDRPVDAIVTEAGLHRVGERG